MNVKATRACLLVGSWGAAILCSAAVAISATVPPLGTTDTFAVLGGSTVTNTGSTVVTGDLGVWPGLAITGFPPGIVNGTTHAGDAVAQQAQSDLTTAYNAVAGQACDTDLTGQDLGGMTLTPGAYCFSTSAQLTGTLNLDAQGDPDAVFVFQIASTLTTASSAVVQFTTGGVSNCNVFWQVGSSATLGTGSSLIGTILALTSITLDTGAGVSGQLLARNGAVTLDTNRVDVCLVIQPPTPTPVGPTPTPGGPTPTPTPPNATSIPTLSGGAMPVLVALIALTGIVAIRRLAT